MSSYKAARTRNNSTISDRKTVLSGSSGRFVLDPTAEQPFRVKTEEDMTLGDQIAAEFGLKSIRILSAGIGTSTDRNGNVKKSIVHQRMWIDDRECQVFPQDGVSKYAVVGESIPWSKLRQLFGVIASDVRRLGVHSTAIAQLGLEPSEVTEDHVQQVFTRGRSEDATEEDVVSGGPTGIVYRFLAVRDENDQRVPDPAYAGSGRRYLLVDGNTAGEFLDAALAEVAFVPLTEDQEAAADEMCASTPADKLTAKLDELAVKEGFADYAAYEASRSESNPRRTRGTRPQPGGGGMGGTRRADVGDLIGNSADV